MEEQPVWPSMQTDDVHLTHILQNLNEHLGTMMTSYHPPKLYIQHKKPAEEKVAELTLDFKSQIGSKERKKRYGNSSHHAFKYHTIIKQLKQGPNSK